MHWLCSDDKRSLSSFVSRFLHLLYTLRDAFLFHRSHPQLTIEVLILTECHSAYTQDLERLSAKTHPKEWLDCTVWQHLTVWKWRAPAATTQWYDRDTAVVFNARRVWHILILRTILYYFSLSSGPVENCLFKYSKIIFIKQHIFESFRFYSKYPTNYFCVREDFPDLFIQQFANIVVAWCLMSSHQPAPLIP